MFAGDGAAELADQVAEFFHGGAENGDALRAHHVEGDAAVDAAFAEMSVIDGDAQLPLLQKLVEAAQISAQLGGRDRDIFGSGPGPRESRPSERRSRVRIRAAATPSRARWDR